MGDNNEAAGEFGAAAPEEIEIEFVDEDTGADSAATPSAGTAPTTGPEAIELGPSVEVEIERLESELDELRDIHLRKLAEFDNFRKRTEREQGEIRRYANEDLVRDLLPVLDNFTRALEHSAETDAGAFQEGVEMIAKQLWDTLERQGLTVIDPIGEKFSPEFHEAVHRVEDDNLEPGTIATVLVKGYLYNGRLIRPAMVGVVAEATKPNGAPDRQTNGPADE